MSYSYNRRCKTAVLKQKHREESDRQEWALFDSEGAKVLEWFGPDRPSDERVQKAEARVQFFKNKRAAWPFRPTPADEAQEWQDEQPR